MELPYKPWINHSRTFKWQIPNLFKPSLFGVFRGWDGWVASLTRWTWVWVNSGSWWCTGRPGVLRFMGSQRVGHDWVTELNWTRLVITFFSRTSVVRGILQARILEWAAYPFSSGSSRLRNRTRVSCIAGKFFTNWEQLILFAYMIKDLTVATPSLDQPRVQGHQPWFAASCHAGPCPAK